jgi:hypothetical protein
VPQEKKVALQDVSEDVSPMGADEQVPDERSFALDIVRVDHLAHKEIQKDS